ncbi:MAG TPA: CsiV family protein [Steroidobacteraceae bacterium]|nr:CsiV family protein [Steroidobacteraceae bacterium]
MRLRDLALAACLLCFATCTSALAQQASSAAGVAPAAEPHPLPAAAPVSGAGVYNVEIIIFRALASVASPENWGAEATQAPAVPASGDEDNATPASDTAAAPGSAPAPLPVPVPGGRLVRVLTPAEFQLGDLEARIKSSGAYAAVAHIGWAQTASPWGTHESMSLQQLGLDNPQLAGTVTLEHGQYLHLGFALNMTIANPPAGLGAASPTTFVLDDNHRVKFYERNYYDSPAFGVIALVVPAQGARRAGR